MMKIEKVREYDRISYSKLENSEHPENDCKSLKVGEEEFKSLEKYLEDFEKTTNKEEDEEKIWTFMRRGSSKGKPTIYIQNYVGTLRLSKNTQLEILPKIELTDDEDYKKTKKIFVKMLKTLLRTRYKSFRSANLKNENMSIFEFYINMYLTETWELVKRGLKHGYVNEEDNLRFFKGKLLTNKHIRHNLIHKERFYVSYDDFLPNRPENRLIKATILKLHKIAWSPDNKRLAQQLLSFFDLVETSFNYDKDFSEVKLDRSMQRYKDVLTWSRAFLYDKSFTPFSGDSDVKALLFNMNELFETYVAHKVKKYCPEGWEVKTQDKEHHLFEKPKRFLLKPDIVLAKGQTSVVMDTKWKRLNNRDKNYGIEQSDMYQMYAYSKKYGAKDIYLIYPLNNDVKDLKQDITFDSGDGTVVHIYFIDLELIDDENNMASIPRLLKTIEII